MRLSIVLLEYIHEVYSIIIYYNRKKITNTIKL